MYHFYDVVINDKTGVPLGGVIVRVYDDAGSIVPLYADENGAVPIEAVSGLANAAVTDDAGNYNFYVSDGTYDIQFFVGDAVLYVLPNILMGFPDVTGKAQADALGVSGNADSMGVFSGSIIPDNQSAKQALQALEDATEQRPTNPQLDIVTAQTASAIQSVVNSSSDNGQRVDILKRDYPLNAAVVSGVKAVEYQGAGPEATRLLVDGPRSAIEHGLDSQVYYASLSIRNLSICATSAAIGTAQTAIKAKFDKSSGGFLLENVVFRPFSDSYDFAQYVHATGATRTTFRNIRALGSTFDADSATDVQIAFRFTSNNNADKSYEYVFDDITVQAEQSGFLFEVLGMPGDSGSLEGITMTNIRGRTNLGPLIDFKVVNGGWKPPFFSVSSGFNYQGTGAIAHFDGIESLTIAGGGWHYCDAATASSPTLNQIQLRNARKVIIRDQTFYVTPGCKLQWVISVEGGCSDVLIENCTFIYTGAPTACAGGIFVDATLVNVVARNCTFIGWPAGLPKAQYSDGRTIPIDETMRRLNALPQFGALGDNVADDRGAFVSANGYGGLNFIPKPPSKYKLATPFATTTAAWLPDPSMTWAQLTDSGKFDMTRDFFSDGFSYFGNIWRFSDRLFVGNAAAHFAGSGSLPDQGNAWLKSADDGPAYLAANAQLLSMPTDTRYAIVGAAKTTLSGAGGAIGVGSVLIADGAKPGWGFIAELQREGTAAVYGIEVAAKNKGSNTTMGVNAQQVGVFGVWLSAGGDGVFGGLPTAPSTAGVAFVKGHAPGTTWNDGIIFQRDAMTSDRVLKMSSVGLTGGHYYSWFNASDSETFVLRGSAVAAGVTWKMEVNDNGFNFLRNTGNLLNISGAASAVNGVQIYGGAAGVSPQLVARGDDANQDMNVRGKGTGGGALTDGGGAYKVRTNTTGVGFNGSAPIAKPAISGSRGGNAALADLLSKLVSYGLITDGTTA